MPWCPECRTEYRPEFDTCSDCGTALVPNDPQIGSAPKQVRVWPSYAQVPGVAFFSFSVAVITCVTFGSLTVVFTTIGVECLGWTGPEWVYIGLSCLLAINVYTTTSLYAGCTADQGFSPVYSAIGWLIGLAAFWLFLFWFFDLTSGSIAQTIWASVVILVIAPAIGATAMALGARYRRHPGPWLLILTAILVAFGIADICCRCR